MKPTFLSTTSEQARTAQLFAHVRDAVIMIDPTGVVGFWSQGAARIYGRPAPEALNRCYPELLPARCRTAQVPHLHRALDGEESSAEWQTTTRDGTPMWLEGDFRPVCDERGRRSGCAVLLHDVTKWRAAEAARKASDQLLRTVTDQVPGAVFQLRVGPDGARSIPFVSRGVEALLERTPAELNAGFGSGNLTVIPEDRPAFWESLEESRRGLRTWDAEYRVRTVRTGTAKWVRIRATPTRAVDGATIWNGVMTDVTDQVAAAAALRESEARYRLLTDNATDVIARLTPGGVFVYVSPASQTLFGIPPDGFVGRHIRDAIHPDDAPRVMEVFGTLAAGRDADAFAHRCLAKAGAPVWCESTVRAVRDEAGAVAEVVMVTRSIEERRRLEARVRQAQKMEAIGRLAGGVAHDFNNLLTVINGFSELVMRALTRPHDPARLVPQMQEIRKAGERASALTKQLLAFGRQHVQTRTRVNLNEVVEDSRKLLARVLGEDVEVRTELSPDPVPVHVDIGQLQQVLMNLAVNSRDAMPDGGTLTLATGEARFDTAPEDDVPPGSYVMLAVSDTGVGMDAHTQGQLFEPFFTTKEQGKGTGLGLATVYGIVKQTGGFVTVESEVGTGTTFRVYLPRYESLADGAIPRPGESVLAGRETVLLVEDDDGVRRVTSTMLRTLGYQVVEAAGGVEALKLCREYPGPIHLLLTDVVMPAMNGREVADRVRAVLPGVRTVFMSGYTDDAILRHGVLDRGVAFVGKPLTHDVLGRKLREVLSAQPGSVG